jgi:hypothetical protein
VVGVKSLAELVIVNVTVAAVALASVTVNVAACAVPLLVNVLGDKEMLLNVAVVVLVPLFTASDFLHDSAKNKFMQSANAVIFFICKGLEVIRRQNLLKRVLRLIIL